MKLKETQIIAISNLKGGVGKTTTASNLSAGLARLGYKVLGVDWDPQGNLTTAFGIQDNEELVTLYQALDPDNPDFYKKEDLKPYNIPLYKDNLFLFPTNYDLSKFEPSFSTQDIQGAQYVLTDVLDTYIDDMDFIIIDCQPSLSLLTLNAYYAADYLLIPVEAGAYNVQGLDKILDIITRSKKRFNNETEILGVFFSRCEPNTILTKDYMADFEVREDVPLFESVVRRNVALAECVESGQDIFSYDEYLNEDVPEDKRKPSIGAEDFYNLINEALFKMKLTKEFSSSRVADEGVNSSTESDAPAPIQKLKSKKKGNLADDFKNFLNK